MLILIGMLLFVVLIVALIWLALRWLYKRPLFVILVAALIWLGLWRRNKRKRQVLLAISPQQDFYPPYEQRYQPPHQAPAVSQEEGQWATYEQPQAEYPQLQVLPPQY